MHNFNVKVFLCSIIVLTGIMLSNCNSGTPVISQLPTVTPLSSTKSIESFTIERAISVDMNGYSINVAMPYGTNFNESLNVKFTTTGKTVTLNGIIQNPDGTLNNFKPDVTVVYIVFAEDSSTQNYNVTVTTTTPFRAYYPTGCTLLNLNNCTCVQDTTTGDVWMVTPSDSANQSYISLMNENGYIDNLNNNQTCEFKDGNWSLPSEKQLNTIVNYVSEELHGEKATWFNKNGFKGIDNEGKYWGKCLDYSKCSNFFENSANAWYMSIFNGTVSNKIRLNFNSPHTYGWGVHSKP